MKFGRMGKREKSTNPVFVPILLLPWRDHIGRQSWLIVQKNRTMSPMEFILQTPRDYWEIVLALGEENPAKNLFSITAYKMDFCETSTFFSECYIVFI